VRELTGLEISYAELTGRVRRLSGALRARGVERGVVVGVLLPRSIDAVVSLLAVHVAGGAFVPLDPAAPRQRLEFNVRDSGAKAVLVCGETHGRLESAQEIDIESPAVTRAQVPPGPLAFPESTSLAYVIYTSGSTGEPKGVCVSHGALANHIAAMLDRFALGQHDRVLQFTPLTVDVFLEEMLPTLVAGATLVLRSDGHGTLGAVWSVSQGDASPFINVSDAAGVWQGASPLDPDSVGLAADLSFFSASDVATTWFRAASGGQENVVARRLR
jgi:non-ribosomal peptide synthetase component F